MARAPVVQEVLVEPGLDLDMTEDGSKSSELIEARANESVLCAKCSQIPSVVFFTAMTPIAPTE